ncbi:hypothetical protein Ancab_010332, partial [Ancistrocladus abbreviatus]
MGLGLEKNEDTQAEAFLEANTTSSMGCKEIDQTNGPKHRHEEKEPTSAREDMDKGEERSTH